MVGISVLQNMLCVILSDVFYLIHSQKKVEVKIQDFILQVCRQEEKQEKQLLYTDHRVHVANES